MADGFGSDGDKENRHHDSSDREKKMLIGVVRGGMTVNDRRLLRLQQGQAEEEEDDRCQVERRHGS